MNCSFLWSHWTVYVIGIVVGLAPGFALGFGLGKRAGIKTVMALLELAGPKLVVWESVKSKKGAANG